jgi:2-hydroxy-3-keto-5-methylthiopentenyl-1-phosphate phosphatase
VLILCDFDGTFTCEDVTNLIWDRFIGPSWRGDLLGSYKSGQITHLKIMVDGYRMVKAGEREMLDYVRPRVRLRPGFDRLRSISGSRGLPLTVLSGGLDFYIRAFLPAGLEFYSYCARQPAPGAAWEVFEPQEIHKKDAGDFKVQVKQLLKKKHGKERVLFIGDGRNDLPVARLSDVVFAVRGSTLAHLCAEEKKPVHEFDDFAEIAAFVEKETRA